MPGWESRIQSHPSPFAPTHVIHAGRCTTFAILRTGRSGAPRFRSCGRCSAGLHSGAGGRGAGSRIAGDGPGPGPRRGRRRVQRRRAGGFHAHALAGRGDRAFARAVARPGPHGGCAPLADASRRGAGPDRPHRARGHPSPGRGDLRRAVPLRAPAGAPRPGRQRVQRDGGPAARVRRARDAARDRASREQPGTGGPGRAAQSAGARCRGGRRGNRGRSGRARRLRRRLPFAADRIEARPRRGRRARRLRFLGPRRTPLRRQPGPQRIPSPAPWHAHRVADPGGGAGRGARPLPLPASPHVEDAGAGRACRRRGGAHHEHLDGQPPAFGLDGLRGRGAGTPGDAVRRLRRQQRRRHRRDTDLARRPRARQSPHRHLLGRIRAPRAGLELGAEERRPRGAGGGGSGHRIRRPGARGVRVELRGGAGLGPRRLPARRASGVEHAGAPVGHSRPCGEAGERHGRLRGRGDAT